MERMTEDESQLTHAAVRGILQLFDQLPRALAPEISVRVLASVALACGIPVEELIACTRMAYEALQAHNSAPATNGPRAEA